MAQPQHVSPGMDVTVDPTFHPDHLREQPKKAEQMYLISEILAKQILILVAQDAPMDEDEFVEIAAKIRANPYTTTASDKQTASQMCDNFLEEIQDIVKEHSKYIDDSLLQALGELHFRVSLWKERKDVKDPESDKQDITVGMVTAFESGQKDERAKWEKRIADVIWKQDVDLGILQEALDEGISRGELGVVWVDIPIRTDFEAAMMNAAGKKVRVTIALLREVK